ncbi:MAG: primosomal protein N' [Flammeovirgaceae bacterium]|nr:primosomal protein N' [Flammeovirgaceae bacterium]
MPELFTDTQFAEVLLPVPIHKLFTYRVPQTLNDSIQIGQRAIVQFGDRKILTGIIINIHQKPPVEYEAKYILDLLDDYPVVSEKQLQLMTWMAGYYCCTPGEVMNAALPSGLKLSSESFLQINPAFTFETTSFEFSDREEIVLRRLVQGPLSYSEVGKLLGIKNVYSIIKSLVGKETVLLLEEVKDKYKPKTEKKIRLTESFNNPEKLQELFELLSSKPKQESVLLKYLQLVPVLQDVNSNESGVAKNILANDLEISESSIKTLIKQNVFEEFDVIVPRLAFHGEPLTPSSLLSEVQDQAKQEIITSFTDHSACLLQGITGSGKTEIYIQLIKQAIDGGSQVLYLLPEIALTTQIVQRLQKIFGNDMGVYHSKFSDNERVEVWNGLIQGKYKFIVGVRSSIFLPFDNLGLIIVDEEHDPSYKQQEPAPRYHARDVTLMMAQLHHAKVLLASATPSLESFFNATTGKYGYVKLTKRFGEATLPKIVLADIRKERQQKTVKGEFTKTLLKSIEESLAGKEQVIIFQNRRGYSPTVTCETCGWTPKCVNCAVSLTYHQFKHAMICHYCGYREAMPNNCPSCGGSRLLTLGYGTEKLEEELRLYFPEKSVQRMDLDTTRSKTGYESIIENFEQGKTDILVGTQMVTKGLDFDKVSLVGVFNADRMMHFPDFRSHERAYQLLTQVSGRAGRREKPGLVVIQTSSPDHYVLDLVLNHKADEFYARELNDRQVHGYPPFTRLIELTVRHIDKKISRDLSSRLAEEFKDQLHGIKVLGPGEPMVGKIRNQYLMNILLKIPKGKIDLPAMKHTIQKINEDFLKIKEYRSARIVMDVDPV